MQTSKTLYDEDFALWAEQQAALLRTGKWQELDQDHLVEELEDLSRRERQALRNRYIVLLTHLLKWQYQPNRRTRSQSWHYTIREQRLAIGELLADSPSLRPTGPTALTTAYPRARLRAAKETQLPEETFPPSCPWTWEQALDKDFWPET